MGITPHQIAAAFSVFLSLSTLPLMPSALCLLADTPLPPHLTRQTLLFRDAETGVPVHIIGTMHYNPHSVAKTEAIVRSYGERGHLSSVVIETCDTRWNRTQSLQPPGSLLRRVLDNEFQAAAEVASAYYDHGDGRGGGRVVLADEDIVDNDGRIDAAFRSTVRDLLDPLGGGWTAVSNDIRRGYGDSVAPPAPPGGEPRRYLDRSDLLDPSTLLSAPVSLARYALAASVRKPLRAALLAAWISLLVRLLSTRGHLADLTPVEGVATWAGGLAMSVVVGVPLLGRVVLVALLGERNEILAGNIRAECRRIAEDGVSAGGGGVVCVAVLGLAHCNGVKRLLTDRLGTGGRDGVL